MPRYVYDPSAKTFVKVSDRIPYRGCPEMERPFSEQILRGYQRIEERRERSAWRPGRLKELWGAK